MHRANCGRTCHARLLRAGGNILDTAHVHIGRPDRFYKGDGVAAFDSGNDPDMYAPGGDTLQLPHAVAPRQETDIVGDVAEKSRDDAVDAQDRVLGNDEATELDAGDVREGEFTADDDTRRVRAALLLV